jgi:hypothetical protein
MASAITELERLRARLESQMQAIRAELDTISKTIKILEREIPGVSPQMNLPVVTLSQHPASVHNEAKGLSDLCREFLGEKWMGPTEVRDVLLMRGYHNTDRGKLLSSVYATLKRLTEKTRELESRKTDGRTEFHKLASQQAA